MRHFLQSVFLPSFILLATAGRKTSFGQLERVEGLTSCCMPWKRETSFWRVTEHGWNKVLTLKTFPAKHMGSLGYGEMPRGTNYEINFFLSPYILTFIFLMNFSPGKSQLSASVSPPQQLRFLHCHKEKSPIQTTAGPAVQYSCG